MDLGLAGRVAVVTGGSAGIGLTTARMFLQEGARVAICARDSSRLDAALAELSKHGEVFGQTCDVVDESGVASFISAAAARFGRLDVLVNNAGASRVASFAETSIDGWRKELDLKYFGLIYPVRAAVEHMRRAGGGRIVNVNAILARQPERHLVATSAARAGILNLSHSLATELAVDGILVNTVLLGGIVSEQWRRRYRQTDTSATEDQWLGDIARDRGVPLGRFGQPEEVAAAILFLASSQASYITGATLEIGGGVSRYV
ncbi:MAG TPA: SDR family oxidoreductase [Chloroflexota bacterium]|nr:SDR family oxidoreductase [Chloroflexota bacterium]